MENRTAYRAQGDIPADIPTERWYKSQHRAEIDQALVEAINLAQVADQTKRARQLALQVRSLYLETHDVEYPSIGP